MKWINIILSVYLIVLSSLPCEDKIASETNSHTTQIVDQSHDPSHETGSDLCPPFCSCNCCMAQVLNAAPIISWSFNNDSSLIKKPLSSYYSTSVSNFYGSIWQPPQLV